MSPGTYAFKPRFQDGLRPCVRILAQTGVRANGVTAFTCIISVAFGAVLTFSQWRALFLLMPIFLPIRMALNAADGMLAREYGQRSALGVYWNELGDVVADAFCWLPFVRAGGVSGALISVVVVLSVMSELAGTIAAMNGGERRYDGPMGKSDRAVIVGALGFWIGVAGHLPAAVAYSFPAIVAVLLVITIISRVRKGVEETNARA